MEVGKTRASPRIGLKASSANGHPRKPSIFSDRQWHSLALSLGLSDRELEVLQCIFDDQTERIMAQGLGISVHTIHTHLERLYRKLGVSSRCSAVIYIFTCYLSKHSSGRAVGRFGGRTVRSRRPRTIP